MYTAFYRTLSKLYNKHAALFWENFLFQPHSGGLSVQYINTTLFMGLSVWLIGFVLMTAGWLVDVLFESYGIIPSKILYKSGAIIVAVPVIYLLWKMSRLIYTQRLNIVMFLRDGLELFQYLEGFLTSL